MIQDLALLITAVTASLTALCAAMRRSRCTHIKACCVEIDRDVQRTTLTPPEERF